MSKMSKMYCIVVGGLALQEATLITGAVKIVLTDSRKNALYFHELSAAIERAQIVREQIDRSTIIEVAEVVYQTDVCIEGE